jgi:gliding motility-associated-like protein
VEVEVVDLPTVSTNGQTQFCEGEIYLLEATVTGAGIVQWEAQEGSLLGNANEITAVVSGEGQYSIEAFSALDGCTAIATVEVDVLPLPDYNPAVLSICPYEQATLEIPELFGVVAWWNGFTDQSVTVDEQGSYTAEITDGVCTNEIVFEVQVWDVPNLELGPDIAFCLQDEPLTLIAGTEVIWDDGTQSSTLDVTESGIYHAVWNDGNCQVIDDVAVQITLPPNVLISGPDGFCEGEEAVLQSSHTGVWSSGEVGNTLTVNAVGLYAIDVQDGPCQSTQVAQVQMWQAPVLELGPDIAMCDDQLVTLSAGDENSDSHYLWSTGEVSSTIEIASPGLYTCIKTNTCGQREDSVFVDWMDCETQLFIPNSFSPNADGINDVWNVVGFNASNLRIQIFDRWGLLVFESTDADKPWLGDHQGGTTFVPSDVYHYVIQFVDIRGEHKRKTGIVSVIR